MKSTTTIKELELPVYDGDKDAMTTGTLYIRDIDGALNVELICR